jgi:putative nucleotidyltransferase-like protein
MSSDGTPARDLAAALLSSCGATAWPPDVDAAAFVAWAEAEGLSGLLYARVYDTGEAARLPAALVDGLRAGARRQAAVELAARAELQRIVAAVDARQLEMLLIKGASLAYDVYADPSWRVRADTDLFIRGADRAAMRACLEELGYACEPEASGRLVAYQFHAERRDGRMRHLCDVHWKIANPQRFAGAVTFDELAGAAIPLPLIGSGARGLGRPHALWLACVHRAAHHYDRKTLIWLFDVHLLVQSLDPADAERFVALAARAGVRRICLRALLLARELFGTSIPAAVLAALESAPADEPSAVFLNERMRGIDVLVDDIRALPGWRPRVRLLAEMFFPAPAYMRRTYAPGSTAPLAWLYARRLVKGGWTWLRRERSAMAPR